MQNPFFPDIKRVHYIIITVGKVRSHESFVVICRSSRPQVFYKVGALKNFAKFTVKHQRQSLFKVVGRRPEAYYFIKKETPAQVQICKILKNTFFIEQLWTTASGYIKILTAKKFQYQTSLLAKVTKRQEGGEVNYFSLHTSTIKNVL